MSSRVSSTRITSKVTREDTRRRTAINAKLVALAQAVARGDPTATVRLDQAAIADEITVPVTFPIGHIPDTARIYETVLSACDVRLDIRHDRVNRDRYVIGVPANKFLVFHDVWSMPQIVGGLCMNDPGAV